MTGKTIGMRAWKAWLLIAGMVALAWSVVVSPASASEAITSFSVSTSTTQAGGHPDITTSFELDSPGVPESARNVSVNLPEGIFGNPNATIQCSSEEFAFERCPAGSQVGYVTVYANSEGDPKKILGTAPIFNRNAVADETALFGFIVPALNFPVSIPVAVRTGGDFGLRLTVAELTQVTPLAAADLTYWGFPADPVNDAKRFPKGATGDPAGCVGFVNTSCLQGSTAAAITVRPLINNPSLCKSADDTVSLTVQTYQDPDNPTEATTNYPASTGCEAMTFKPVLFGTPTTLEADSAAGLDLQLAASQPFGRSTTPSSIKSSILTLPEGLTINPGAADGQLACSDADANFGSEAPAECPDNAKIGTFAVDSPSIDGPLEGAIYFGEPTPQDQYRLFLIADGFGIHAKFLGIVRPDAVTGRLTTYLSDLPQVPFETFDLHLFASDRGLMATPTRCRIYEVEARFFPWNDVLPDQNTRQVFSINSGANGAQCPGATLPFNPRLFAGTSSPTGGAFSDFALQLDRDDGDQFLGDLNFTMPPGFTGSLRGISYCPEASILAASSKKGRAEQALPSCPASSQIGTTNVAAGPGTHPFNVVGAIYLAGPFKGAPLSLAAITPALAGPYDYGTQVVRVALHVDSLDAHVTALSDTVPSIIGGVPIRLRTIRVNLNRPNFLINPTNCQETTIHSEGVGDQGTVTGFDSYFHPVNCASLPFKPKMTIRQVGKRKDTKRARNPKLQFDLRTRAGDANIKALTVTLPHAFEIDQRHLGNICSEKELTVNQCAGRTPIGTASTTTPLLDQPLTGPAYAVSGSGGLPRLAFILAGQVTIIPRADTETVGGKLQTTVPVVPDAPIGHFSLTVLGGKTGYLINTRDICAHRPVIRIAYTGQNGKTHSEAVKLKSPCGKKKARVKRHRR
jgi:hypothetical protein